MRLFTAEIKPEKANIYLLGDTHAGALAFHEKAFDKAIATVADDPHAKVIGMGDFIEAISTDDPRFFDEAADKRTPTPLIQAQWFTEKLKPIKNKILAVNCGNHELKLHRIGDLTRDIICKELDVPYGTYSHKMTFKDTKGRKIFKGFFTHGNGQITSNAKDPMQREANLKASLKKKLEEKWGDCLVMAMGHTHKLLVAEPTSKVYLTDDGSNINDNHTKPDARSLYIPDYLRWYVNTGSWLRLYVDGTTTYPERFNYDPVEIGYPVIRVRENDVARIDRIVI